jgi:hypothetical protein
MGAGIVIAGCGGGETPPAQTDAASTPTASPSPPKATKTQGRRGREKLADGGDMDAHERRAAKLKEKKAAGE